MVVAEPGQRRKLAAILSADVAGYSRLMAADERATLETLNAYREVFRQQVTDRDGRVVDAAGFSGTAVDMQRSCYIRGPTFT